jgi:hypothetical protein
MKGLLHETNVQQPLLKKWLKIWMSQVMGFYSNQMSIIGRRDDPRDAYIEE